MKDGNVFQAGEVWESPRGLLYKVIEIANGQAVMRSNIEGSGKKRSRPHDSVVGWTRWSPEDIESHRNRYG